MLYMILHMSILTTYTRIALGALVLTAPGVVWAQSAYSSVQNTNPKPKKSKGDPGEYYLVVFGLCKDADELAAQGNYAAAMKKGRQAEKVLAQIERDFPDWKPEMVYYRRNKLAKALAQYKQASVNAPIPTGREPGKTLPKDIPFDPVDKVTPKPKEPRPAVVQQPQPNQEAANKELQETLTRLKADLSRVTHEYAKLNEQYSQVQNELQKAKQEAADYKKRYEEQLTAITKEREDSNAVLASYERQLKETTEKLHKSEEARKAAEQRAEELSTKLAETERELRKVTSERDALKAENEQLRAIVDLNDPGKTKALYDQNLSLSAQLEQARRRVEELESQISGSSDEREVLNQQIEEANKEVEQLRDQLSAIYDENRGYRRRVSDLTERLNNLEAAAAAQASSPTVDPALVEETKLLKDIIAKQRRTIAMQEEGRQMMLDTYKQLKSENADMLAQLKKLEEESKLELTEAERSMIEAIRKGEHSTEQEDTAGTEAVRRSLSIETLRQQADNAFNKRRYTAAEQLYRTLYDYQPDHVPCLVNLGTILLYRNKCEEAIEYLVRATRLAPDLPISYYLAGICYYRLDRMNEAEQMFIRTIELDPANAEAFFYLANIEGTTGRTELALSHFAAAVKLNPNLADAHYNMARLYAEMGRIPDSARAYDRAIKAGAEPDDEFYNYLAKHPDNKMKPGADLVARTKPEALAQELKKSHSGTDAPTDVTDTPHDGESTASDYTPEEEEYIAVSRKIDELYAMTNPNTGDASQPSPAAPTNQKHATKTVRGTYINSKGKRRTKTVKLRMRPTPVQRVHTIGGETKVLTPDKDSEKDKKKGSVKDSG